MTTDGHTFLFCDLVGFTALTDSEGDERAAAVAAALHNHACRLAAQHRAEVVKAMGDAAMIRCEDPAAAVLLALRLVDRVEADPALPDRDPGELACSRQGALADEHLAAGRHGAEPGRDVDGAAVPVAVQGHRRSAVDADADRRQGGVGLDSIHEAKRHADRSRRILAANHRRVAHRLHDLGAVLLGQAAGVGVQRGRDGRRALVALGVRQRREADEVAEQEGVPVRGHRAPAITSAPRLGTLVIVLRTECSGRLPTGRIALRETSSRSTTAISNSAKAPPRQRRTPPPNGIHV